MAMTDVKNCHSHHQVPQMPSGRASSESSDRLQAQVFNPELFYFPTGSSENQPSVETIFPWKCLVFPAKVLRKGSKGFSAEAEDLYKM